MALVERFKQESMNGLFAHQDKKGGYLWRGGRKWGFDCSCIRAKIRYQGPLGLLENGPVIGPFRGEELVLLAVFSLSGGDQKNFRLKQRFLLPATA